MRALLSAGGWSEGAGALRAAVDRGHTGHLDSFSCDWLSIDVSID